MITEALTAKLVEAEEKNLMTPKERQQYTMDQFRHEYAMRLKAENELHQARKWARAWKWAAKTRRFRFHILRVMYSSVVDNLLMCRRFAKLWKQAAKGWRQAALEAQHTNGVLRVPVVGELSAKTTPADFARWNGK